MPRYCRAEMYLCGLPWPTWTSFFIVASTVQPVPSTLVIDKLSAIAVDRGAQPVLVITKGDLYGADALAQCYTTAGFPVLCVNAATGEGLAPLRDMLAGKLSVFSGNSGVGKSTLLGALMPGRELETAEISQKLGRGRHTTREVVLYEAHGGLVADTPGFASLDMARAAAIPKENLELAFPDIARLFGQCRFTGCSHLSEVGCAVREAVHRGEISRTRYESYAALYEQAKGAGKAMNRRCVIFAGCPWPRSCVKILARKTSSLRRTPAGKRRGHWAFPALALGDFDTAPAPEGPDVLRLPAEKDDTDTFLPRAGRWRRVRRGADTGRHRRQAGPHACQYLYAAVPGTARRVRMAAQRNGGCARAFCRGNMGSPRKGRICISVSHEWGRAWAVPARLPLSTGKRSAQGGVHAGHQQ